jgi:signal transduction histidine kinase
VSRGQRTWTIVIGAAMTVAGVEYARRWLRMRAGFDRSYRELLALHEAGLDIASELNSDLVLQRVVDRAMTLLDARYGALSVPSPDGGIETFVTGGITPTERELIGPPPMGHGLLGVVLADGRRLRLADLRPDPRSVGFPPRHPVMRSLLAVPVVSNGRVLGNLCVAEKLGRSEFSRTDEETLVRFATQAAVAIENARLHREVRDQAVAEERERLARELHDSLAQVLGYVSTKAQAAQELLRAGQPERAAVQIAQLGEAAREAYADVREGILGLRTSLGPGRSLSRAIHEYVARWHEQTGLAASVAIEPSNALEQLTPAAELQLLRIVQEALANVRKHAGAGKAEVCITRDDGVVQVAVADDGRGFDVRRGRAGNPGLPQFGLATMRERAESVGGALEVVSTRGAGTRVVARIPVGAGPTNATTQ